MIDVNMSIQLKLKTEWFKTVVEFSLVSLV